MNFIDNYLIFFFLYYSWLAYQLYNMRSSCGIFKKILTYTICILIIISIILTFITSNKLYLMLPILPYTIFQVISTKI
jgi:hypothetical protein